MWVGEWQRKIKTVPCLLSISITLMQPWKLGSKSPKTQKTISLPTVTTSTSIRERRQRNKVSRWVAKQKESYTSPPLHFPINITSTNWAAADLRQRDHTRSAAARRAVSDRNNVERVGGLLEAAGGVCIVSRHGSRNKNEHSTWFDCRISLLLFIWLRLRAADIFLKG